MSPDFGSGAFGDSAFGDLPGTGGTPPSPPSSSSGWVVDIDGTDRTSQVLRTIDVTLSQNDRSTARFTCKPGFVVDQFADVRIGAPGETVTPIFGGFVLKRQARAVVHPAALPYVTECECVDYFAYLDYKVASLSYTSDFTLGQFVTDIVALLTERGITVDGAQEVGPTLAARSWMNRPVSEMVRDVSEMTAALGNGWVGKISPDKAFRMWLPGTDAAPVSITQGNGVAMNFEWRDSDQVSVTKVILIVGDSPQMKTQHLVRSSGANSFFIDFPDALDNAWQQFSVSINGGAREETISGPGDGGMWEYTPASQLLEKVSGTALVDGDTIDFQYRAQFPAPITVQLGSPETPVSPEIAIVETDPNITDFAVGEQKANAILARRSLAPREATAWTREHGIFPGMAMDVTLSGRDITATTFIVTEVRLHIEGQKTGGNQIWRYDLDLQESVTYQGDYRDRWQQLIQRVMARAA